MRNALRIFLTARGANRWMVLICLIGASLAEGVGVTTLLPLISVVAEGPAAAGEGSTAARLVHDAFAAFGLSPSLEALLLVVVGGIFAKAGLSLLAMRFVGYSVAEVTARMRLDILRNLFNSSWSYFTKYPLGMLNNLLGGQAQRAGAAFKLSAEMLSNSFQVVVYLLIAFLVSWHLALAAVVVGSIILLVLGRYVRQSRRAGHRQTKSANELGAAVSDSLLGIKSLKAMDRQSAFEELIQDKISAIKKTMRKMVSSKQKLSKLQEPMLVVVMAAGFYLLIELLNLPMAEVLVMGLVMHRSIKMLNKLQQDYQDMAQQEGAYDHMLFMVEETQKHQERLTSGATPTLDQGIRFEDVHFAYTDTPVLHGLDLDFPARSLTVLTGPSGAGKTTLTDLLLGFQTPDSGRILIDGLPLNDIDLRAWRRMIGYVPQELNLFRDSVLVNVTLKAPGVTEAMAREALEAAGALSFVDALPQGIHTEVGERGSQLSGGQRQRILIARALIGRPKLLILDEVTSALDQATEQAICRRIKALSRDLTVISVSHRPAWAAFADQLYHIDQGRAQAVQPRSEPARLSV